MKDGYYEEAIAAFEKNDFRTAIKHFLKDLKIAPNYSGTYGYLGLCYDKLGNHELALKYFEQALYLNPNLL